MNRVHVCLVSRQPIPNLIPLRMEELKPEEVILLVSPEMAVEARRLERIISPWGIKVRRYPIAPYDIQSARNTCLSVLADLEHEEVTLNVTGGTKIMALAAFEVFRAADRQIVYVDTQDKIVQMLSPSVKRFDFKGVIRVKPYLSSYGQDVVESSTDIPSMADRRPIYERLVKDMHLFEKPLTILNRYSSLCRSAPAFPFCSSPLDPRDLVNDVFTSTLDLFGKHGFLTLRDGVIWFSTLSDVEFVSGGWLEEYVFDVVRSLNPTDVRMKVTVKWDQSGPKPPENEYDVVFTHDNMLYLIECKTKRFEGKDLTEASADPIYKLDSLKEKAGGVYGRGMFVSYRKLTPDQRKRLGANRLQHCDSENLRNLRDVVKRWIS